MSIKLKAALISLAMGILIGALKFYAFFETQAMAIGSDAIESLNNVVAALFSAYAIWQGEKKEDFRHLYGKGRLEYFSAAFEGALILFSGVWILFESGMRFLKPTQLENLPLGLGFLVFATLLNALLSSYLVRAGKKQHSPALIADGLHVWSDVASSLGVLGGLFLVWLSGWNILDNCVSILMGFWILWSGLALIRKSFAQLMDRADPELLDRIQKILTEYRKMPMIYPHELRLRELGSKVLIDFHLVVPRFLQIHELHQFEKDCAEFIRQKLERPLGMMIHADPCKNIYCRVCSMTNCPIRSSAQEYDLPWNLNLLVNRVPEWIRLGHKNPD